MSSFVLFFLTIEVTVKVAKPEHFFFFHFFFFFFEIKVFCFFLLLLLIFFSCRTDGGQRPY